MEVARPSVYANVLFTRLSDGRGVIKAGRKRKEKEGKKERRIKVKRKENVRTKG